MSPIHTVSNINNYVASLRPPNRTAATKSKTKMPFLRLLLNEMNWCARENHSAQNCYSRVLEI